MRAKSKIRRGGMGTGMPYWGSIFTEEELAALVDYLWTFSMATVPFAAGTPYRAPMLAANRSEKSAASLLGKGYPPQLRPSRTSRSPERSRSSN